MATSKNSQAAAVKGAKPAVKKAPSKAAVKAQPKKTAAVKAQPKKSATTPAPSAKKPLAGKPAPAAKAGGTKTAVQQTKPVTKGAPPQAAPSKDLSKKPVKTAPAPVQHAAPARPHTQEPKAAARPATSADPKKPRFSKEDLDQFKVDLLSMRDRITGQSGSMRNAALQRTDETNTEEDGTDAFMRLQTLEQVSSQQQIIMDIDEALRAIEKSSYGVCDMCGALINKPRLAVLPFAKNCIACQSEVERSRRPGGRR